MRERYRSPWFNLQGYLACTVRFEDGSKRTVLAHREVVEKFLERTLDRYEVVHHKDGNPRNNDISNLEVLSLSAHTSLHSRPAELVQASCRECGCLFELLARKVRHNQEKRKSPGPFCSRSCAGRFNQRKQRTFRGGHPGPGSKTVG